MRGKLVEDIKTVVMHRSKNLVATTATFGNVIDTLGFSEAVVSLNVGSALGPTTLGAQIYEGDANSPVGMIPVTNGAFPLISSSNDSENFFGSVKTQNYKRYIALRLQAGAPGSPTIPVAATVVLGKAQTGPNDAGIDFDLD